MMPNTEQQLYRGVLCLHCSQPIKISALVASREAEPAADEAIRLRGRKCLVFNLRCPACGKEKPYKTSEIREFSGTPQESPYATPASVWASNTPAKSKTANA